MVDRRFYNIGAMIIREGGAVIGFMENTFEIKLRVTSMMYAIPRMVVFCNSVME
jgi:hypothetical protein